MDYTKAIRQLYDLPGGQRYALPEQELAALAARIGTPLPALLLDYYRDFGAHENLNNTHNCLLQPGEIVLSAAGYLVFYEENQGVVQWAMKQTDLQLADPPVWGNYGSEESPDWVLESAALSDFWLLMAVYNGTMGALPYNANAFGPLDQAVATVVAQNWTAVPAISWDKQKVYTRDFREVISLSFDDEGACTAIFAGTADQERFDALMDKLPVDWDYCSYDDMEEEEEEDDV